LQDRCGRFDSDQVHYSPMVKRTSSLASNEVFRVRILVGLLTPCKCYGRHGRLWICKTRFDSSAGY
jgi:hypothetical protein